MKKLLSLGAVMAFTVGISGRMTAQVAPAPQAVPQPTTITDTLHYYFNKYFFKTNVAMTGTAFPYYKAPASTFTGITHCGAKFENKDPNLVVTGLEALVARNSVAVSLSIPIKLYLCSLDANGMPLLPGIDSVETSVAGPGSGLYPALQRKGGDFKTPRTVSGDFVVLVRNNSTKAGDTLRIGRTGGKNFFNPNATPLEKHSDGYGFARYAGKFYSATNYTLAGFGNGTDYEFCVAPRVTYTLQPSHLIPDNLSDFCINYVATFTNTSSFEYSSRFFNLYEFCRKWNQNPGFHPSTVPNGGWPSDSAVTWFFESEDNGGKPGPRVFLPFYSQTNTILFKTDSAMQSLLDEQDSLLCFPSNQFRTRWRGMQLYGGLIDIQSIEEFTICTKACGDKVGLGESPEMQKIRLFPNPANAGVAMLSGLKGRNLVMVTDILGKVVYQSTADHDRHAIAVNEWPSGAYVVRITNQNGSTKTIKLLKE